MTVTSIDLETATLRTRNSRVLNLCKQLKFVEDENRKLKLQQMQPVDTIPIEIYNFLQNELQFEYCGHLESDIKRLQEKVLLERNHHQYEMEIKDKTIIVLEEQCKTFQNEIDLFECIIKDMKMEQKMTREQFELTVVEMKNHLQNQQCITTHENDIDSVDTKNEIFTLSVAIQTDIIESASTDTSEFISEIERTLSEDILMNKNSTGMQTDLNAYDVLTVQNFDELMIQNEPKGIISSPIEKHLIITPPNYNALAFELSEDNYNTDSCMDSICVSKDIQSIDSSEFTIDSESNSQSQFTFNQLFSRTQMRMEKRRQYNELKKERMNQKIKSKKFKVSKKQINPFRCTKVVRKKQI
eukprot:192577_1